MRMGLAEYAATVAGYGVELVDAPEDLIGKIDAVIIVFQGGTTHLEAARLMSATRTICTTCSTSAKLWEFSTRGPMARPILTHYSWEEEYQ